MPYTVTPVQVYNIPIMKNNEQTQVFFSIIDHINWPFLLITIIFHSISYFIIS